MRSDGITLLDTDDVLVQRFATKKQDFSLLREMVVERGTIEDWHKLHELHYKTGELPIGPKFWKCTHNGELIGVCVFSTCKMLSAGRNKVFPHLKPEGGDTKIINTARAKHLNNVVTTNSRMVVDTMYRGVGIAYRFQNIASRMSGYEIIEFQSSMSRFNPFAAKAGFKFVQPARSPHYQKGLALFERHFESPPMDFIGVVNEINEMPGAIARKVIAELKDFYFKNSALEKTGKNRTNGTSKVDAMDVETLVKQLQQLVFAAPLYGVYINPDFGHELPSAIPLLQFDQQSTTDKLALKQNGASASD